uniref:DUF1828 domain-containing protein n=1 Tax=Lactobacillus acidophilus TaxID=1579 RepID=UPI003F5525DE
MTKDYHNLLENAEISIVERDAENGKLKITDAGWTIDYLECKGIDLRKDHKKAEKVGLILNARNVDLEDGEIFVISDAHSKWQAKDKVELAIAAIITTLIDDENYTSFEVE